LNTDGLSTPFLQWLAKRELKMSLPPRQILWFDVNPDMNVYGGVLKKNYAIRVPWQSRIKQIIILRVGNSKTARNMEIMAIISPNSYIPYA